MIANLESRSVGGDDLGLRDALVAAALPVDDLADEGRVFFRYDFEGKPVGYAGLEIYGEHALLRSVVVLPESRGRRLGRRITHLTLERAEALGARWAYLLTTDAAPFFVAFGFQPISRGAAPPAILATRQATTICATATLLAMSISSD